MNQNATLIYRKYLFKGFYCFKKIKSIITGRKINDLEYYSSFFLFLKHFQDEFYYFMGNKKIFYDPLKSAIGYRIYLDGTFEKEELNLCSKYIKHDSIVLDIGANIGTHSVFFSNIAIDGVVFSFEPSKDTFGLLLNNVKSSPNIIPLNIALSDRSELLSFFECEDNALSGLKDTLRSPVKNKTQVICLKGDSLVSDLNLTKIDFIKIDVEGLEEQVLKGLEKTICRNKPIIFCEIFKGKKSNLSPESTINYIIRLGYDAYVMTAKGLSKFTSHSDSESNYLFLPDINVKN
jgi:FkbM family methyltransferase